MISDEYAAGFLDGEGSIGIVLKRGIHYLVVQLSQLDREVLDAFQERWSGKVYGPYGKKDRTHPNRYYQYAVHSRKAEQLLRDVLPHLIVKREKTKIALRFQATFDGKNRYPGKALPAEVVALRQELREAILTKRS